MSTNAANEPIRVRHAELEPASGDSLFRRLCPTCKTGLLLVHRQLSGQLVNIDRCVACGQSFLYTDVSIGGEPVVDVTRPGER